MLDLSHHQDQVPHYSIDSPLILTGYRPRSSIIECMYSMFRWHNQTINIWTSVFYVVYHLAHIKYAPTSSKSKFATVFLIHNTFRAICWLNSWAYHTLVPHSPALAHILCTVDYLGCYLTCFGIGTHLIYIELYDFPELLNRCLLSGGLCVALSVGMSLGSWYQTEKYRWVRMATSIVCVLPYLCGLALAVMYRHRGILPGYYKYLFGGLCCEMIAGMFYMSRFPECRYPRKFDCWLNSHSLWHWFNFGFDWCMYCFVFYASVAAMRVAALKP